MIGDPGGKSAERNLLSKEQLAHNYARIKIQLGRLLDFSPPAIRPGSSTTPTGPRP